MACRNFASRRSERSRGCPGVTPALTGLTCHRTVRMNSSNVSSTTQWRKRKASDRNRKLCLAALSDSMVVFIRNIMTVATIVVVIILLLLLLLLLIKFASDF